MTTNSETVKKVNLKTATRNAPAWVRREINRLTKMAANGGSGSAAIFEAQIHGLKAKYIYPFAHGGL